MAKITVSLPDNPLSALSRDAAHRESELLGRDRSSVLADLDELSRTWDGPIDAGALVRAERRRGLT